MPGAVLFITATIGRNGDAYVSVRLDVGRYIPAPTVAAAPTKKPAAKP